MLPTLNRRRFLLHTGFFSAQFSVLTSTAMTLAGTAARAEDQGRASATFTTLNATEAEGLLAAATRILPEDDSGPGAVSGGVIHFIDRVLGSSRQEWLGLLREGLLELDAQAVSLYHSSRFSTLDSAQQDALLQAIEDTEFFVTLRTLTMAGMFALPEYGGNRNHAGFTLIGFGHQHVWQPPFGYYDADYLLRGE
jgi:gluconate 2-dehydrogenase gamma chain